ncbi:MAG: nitroreductase [Pirellulales bacterium]
MQYPHSYRYVDDAILSRRSVRAFRDTPVGRDVVEDILDVARRAPSGTNTQPWKVYALAGDAKRRLSERLLKAYDEPVQDAHREEFPYYPQRWISPYLERRRKVGFDLYGLLGIARDDKPAMHRQQARNYRFFDAPVGLIFTIDRVMERGSLLDYGMFLQNIMVAARARGLDSCPQAAFRRYHRLLAEVLGLPDSESVVCGMSLGYAAEDAPENRLQTEREPVASFTRFEGW